MSETEIWVCLICGKQHIRQLHSDGPCRCCDSEQASCAIYYSQAEADAATKDIMKGES
jgi:hypothetical protein